MSEDKKEKAAEAPESSSSSGGGKLPALLGVLNLLLTVGIGAIVFLQFQKDKHHEAVSDINVDAPASAQAGGEHGEKKEEGHAEAAHGEHGEAGKTAANDKLITLEQFTVNLSTSPGTPSRFARVVVAVEVTSSEASSELTSKMAPVRNSIIDLFNSKRPADLQTGEGRNFLKEEIRNALNSFLVTGKVKGVYFSNFQVSS
jgi:flagellar FliL protein